MGLKWIHQVFFSKNGDQKSLGSSFCGALANFHWISLTTFETPPAEKMTDSNNFLDIMVLFFVLFCFVLFFDFFWFIFVFLFCFVFVFFVCVSVAAWWKLYWLELSLFVCLFVYFLFLFLFCFVLFFVFSSLSLIVML